MKNNQEYMPLVVNTESTFRLISLEVGRHPVLGNISLTFDNDGDFQWTPKIYTTVIIGANGIGKTYLLKVIVDIFNYLYELNNTETTPRSLGYDYEIRYWYNEHEFTINNYSGEGNVRRNTKVVDKMVCKMDRDPIGVHDCLLPNVVVASAMTVTDKFPVKPLGDMYRYQGIRSESSPSTTGTRTLVRKTVEGLVRCLKVKGGYREELVLLLDVLGFQHALKVRYQIKYKEVFLRGDMNPELLCDIFDNKNKKYFRNRDSDLWGKRYFDKMRDDRELLERICEYYRRLSGILDVQQPHLSVEYDVFQEDIERDAETLLLLSRLDIISFPTIIISKQHQYDFVNSSSGETHLLCQMIGIMSDIKKGGLVLIDEPETSSHPNWQVQYIGWLKKIFREYSSCHFIISTHSHFLLSDLEPPTSTIIALEKTEGRLRNIGEELNTFCWSTDDILYRVFHVRNTRNSVFEEKVADLYNRICRSDNDKNSILSLIEELSSYQLAAGDPLRNLIVKASAYVESI